jgi:hypothetical protein
VYIVWEQKTADGCCWSVLFRASKDGGASFGSALVLAKDNRWGHFGFSSQPRLTVSENGILYVVWRDNSLGNQETFFAKSTNNGDSFDSTINLSRSPGDSNSPQIAASGSNVYVLWLDSTTGDYDIFFTKSTNNGDSFGIVSDLGSGGRNGMTYSIPPQIAASGSNVYVVWFATDSAGSPSGLLFRRSIDNGANFESNISLNRGVRPWAYHQLVVSGSNVYVVWQEALQLIHLSKSTDSGASFGPSTVVTDNRGTYRTPIAPQVAIYGDNVYVTWQETEPNNIFRVLLKGSLNNGGNFEDIITMTSYTFARPQTPNPFFPPRISVSENGSIYELWPDNNFGNLQIFFKQIR